MMLIAVACLVEDVEKQAGGVEQRKRNAKKKPKTSSICTVFIHDQREASVYVADD